MLKEDRQWAEALADSEDGESFKGSIEMIYHTQPHDTLKCSSALKNKFVKLATSLNRSAACVHSLLYLLTLAMKRKFLLLFLPLIPTAPRQLRGTKLVSIPSCE